MREGASSNAPVDWLVVGLGNPGSEYRFTPHNVGFMVAERLREQWGLQTPKAKYRGLLSVGKAELGTDLVTGAPQTKRVAMLWPQTYMNESGRSVSPARGEFKLEPDRILVLHDEIDLPFGEIRTRLGGGLAGHNGLKSIRRELGTPDFNRVRIGVGRPNSTDPELVAAYVLGRFRQSLAEVEELVEAAADQATRVLVGEQAGAQPAGPQQPGPQQPGPRQAGPATDS